MAARNRNLLIALTAVGLALRGYHYLRGASVWQDEAGVLVNVLSKSWGGLLGRLSLCQAAPPLFLWLEKAVALTLGDGAYAFRFPPFLASCAAMVLLAWAAGRLLAPRAAAWAVLLFAVSEQLAWHACETKPYSFDVLTATVLLALYAATRDRSAARRLLLFTLPAPVLIFLSYPAIFLYGGVLAAPAPAVWREKRASGLAAFGLLAVTVGGSFSVLLLGPIRAQHEPALAAYWVNDFAPWGRPWFVPVWTLLSTLEVGRYCCKPLGQVLVPLAVFGAVILWRRGARSLAVLLATPILLALVGAFLHRYPYGGDRIMVYAAPAVVLLVGAGTAAAWEWLGRRHRLAPAALVLLFVPPVYTAAKAVVYPWPTADFAGASAYVESRRLPTDVVAGNDWSDLYYFRGLGSAYHGEAIADAPGRCWVVYSTGERAADGRLKGAYGMGPAGWVAVDRREFAFTTVLLLERPAAKMASGGLTPSDSSPCHRQDAKSGG